MLIPLLGADALNSVAIGVYDFKTYTESLPHL
jgi:hypothetical protein